MLLLKPDGHKYGHIQISDAVWRELRERTLAGIRDKLNAAKLLLAAGGTPELAAGLYTFAAEEYGKLLLLQAAPRVKSGTSRHIQYASEFADHEHKLTLAFNAFAANGHEDCYILDDKGEFNPKEFSWEFNVGLLPDMAARLAIFHTDLTPPIEDPQVQKVPEVVKDYLEKAISEFEKAISSTSP